jgi:mRNA interferase MazF
MKVNRGEIWLVNLDPTVGAEIRKTRPVIVVSSNVMGALPIKLVAPLTEWKDYLTSSVWHVRIEPDRANGLTKTSSVDTLQLRGVDIQRFVKKLGRVSPSTMKSILNAILAVIEYR